MDALNKKKTDRFRFLNLLYERTDGDTFSFIEINALTGHLGIDTKDAGKIVDYLIGEHLVEQQGLDNEISITHQGVVEVERALSEPSHPTHYFPPVVNILQVQSMVGSQIQQGTTSSTQTLTTTKNELDAIRLLVEKLETRLPEIPLGGEKKTEANAELQTLRAQLESPKPKNSILRESLQTLRNLIEGVASNAIAAEVLPLFAPLAAWLSART